MKVLLYIAIGAGVVYILMKNSSALQSASPTVQGGAVGAKVGANMGTAIGGVQSVWNDLSSIFSGNPTGLITN